LERQNPLWVSIGRSKTTIPQEAGHPLTLIDGLRDTAEAKDELKEAAKLTRRLHREQT